MSIVNVTNLSKKFGANEAVKGISFRIEEGRCVSLLGPNGAGKTTTLNMLSGLLTPSQGSIEFKGMKPGDDLRKYIGYLPQHPAFHHWMTGRECLEYIGKLSHLSAEEAVQRTKILLRTVGIEDAANRRISGYSGGMKQRLGLAQAMIHKPKLLILDEPVSSLDPAGRRDVLEMMREIKKETTIVFSTHVLHDAEGISDDVLIIRNGDIIISGSLQDIRAEYQQPVVTIQFENGLELEQWMKAWAGHDLVIEMIRDQDTAKLVVKDLSIMKSLLLRDIVEKGISLRKFEVEQTTLEDLFMKVVGE